MVFKVLKTHDPGGQGQCPEKPFVSMLFIYFITNQLFHHFIQMFWFCWYFLYQNKLQKCEPKIKNRFCLLLANQFFFHNLLMFPWSYTGLGLTSLRMMKLNLFIPVIPLHKQTE